MALRSQAIRGEMTKSGYLFLFLFLGVYSLCSAQDEADGEKFFDSVKVEIRLIDPDSITVQVTALTQDLFNTVWVFPDSHSDDSVFRLFEDRIETYLQARIPVQIDNKNIYMKVVQWKPGGKGRGDGFDSTLADTRENSITLGGKLPKQRKYLKIRVDMWVERKDAAETAVEFSLFHHGALQRQTWSHREKTLRFPISSDSLRPN